MHGNVWEWVYDWNGNYSDELLTDPEGPAFALNKRQKSGSWLHSRFTLRSAKFRFFLPSFRDSTTGFRLAFQSMPADTANPDLLL